jgi:hypothetical protein
VTEAHRRVTNRELRTPGGAVILRIRATDLRLAKNRVSVLARSLQTVGVDAEVPEEPPRCRIHLRESFGRTVKPGPLPRSRSGVAAKRQKALWQCQTIHSRKRRVNHDRLEVAHTATPVGVWMEAEAPVEVLRSRDWPALLALRTAQVSPERRCPSDFSYSVLAEAGTQSAGRAAGITG